VAQDDIQYHLLSAGAGSTAIATSEDFPINYFGQIQVFVSGQITGASPTGANFRYVMSVKSNASGTVTLVDGPTAEYTYNPGSAFHVPTFAIVGADLVVSVQGDASNITDWLVRMVMTGVQH
jgi:hypothetical protein